MPHIQPEKQASIILDRCNQELDKIGRKKLQYVAALIASLSALCTGTVLGWTAQISSALLNGDLGFPLTQDELGWVGSLMPVGAAVLSVFCGGMSEYVGRKMFMIYLVVPLVGGWLLIMFANSVAMLYVGRFITGMVAGSYCVMSPLYTTEISEKDIRGTLGCFTQMMISFGILLAAVVSKYLDIFHYTIICAAIPIVFAIIFMFMPESPVYLLKRNREDAARKSLIRLRGPKYDVDSEIEMIKLSLVDSSSINLKVVKKSFKKTATQKACVIAFGLMAFRVFCGVDAITTFASYNFKQAGVKLDEQTCTIILAAIQTIAGIFQSVVVEKIGRRLLLFVSSVLTSICLTVAGVSVLLMDRVALVDASALDTINYIPLVALCIFLVGYSLGLGPIPWMITGEIFPQEIKSVAISFSGCLSWVFTFVVVKSFLVMMDNLGQDVTYFIFAVFCVVSGVFVLLLVRETKGKSFDEIQKGLSHWR